MGKFSGCSSRVIIIHSVVPCDKAEYVYICVALVSIHKEKEENGSYAGTNINNSEDSYITLC